jgi:hypothetical protein
MYLIALILIVAGICWIHGALEFASIQHWSITCIRAFAGVGLLLFGLFTAGIV